MTRTALPTPRFKPILPTCLLLLGLTSPPLLAVPAPRIAHIERCADLLDTQAVTFCLRVRGLDPAPVSVWLDDQLLPAARLERDGERLTIRFAPSDRRGAPLWIEQAGQRSNAVWLTAGNSHVKAVGPSGMARNPDGIPTYRDLVSVVIEERYDGREEAERLAKRYDGEVVGAIAPLNTYQLRLPARTLIERDAMVLRLGNELTVDAVVVEESSAEAVEGDAPSREPHDGEWAANRFLDAIAYYRSRIRSEQSPVPTERVRVGLIERAVDFDLPAFRRYLGPCPTRGGQSCLFARDADKPDGHGSLVAGILMADRDAAAPGFLAALEPVGAGFEVIVDRNSDAGITANVAASVNLVEDGVRVLNWSWGLHRVGTRDLSGENVDSLIRSGVAMSGYEELLEEFFLWLRREHPDVVVVNSAGNGSTFSSADDYRLPSSFVTEQLLVVGGHQRSDRRDLPVDDPDYTERRRSSNLDMRVDITAAACLRAWTPDAAPGEVHCGTSYATPMVAGVVAAMTAINPALQPDQLRELLRRSAMTIGQQSDFEPPDADDLTAPILPSEREYQLDDRDVGRSARLDMRKALEITVRSRDQVR